MGVLMPLCDEDYERWRRITRTWPGLLHQELTDNDVQQILHVDRLGEITEIGWQRDGGWMIRYRDRKGGK